MSGHPRRPRYGADKATEFIRSDPQLLKNPVLVTPAQVSASLTSATWRSFSLRVSEDHFPGRSYVKNFLLGVEARPPLINETARMARARGRVGARTHRPGLGHHQASGQDAIAVDHFPLVEMLLPRIRIYLDTSLLHHRVLSAPFVLNV
jgi:hypothetical protein